MAGNGKLRLLEFACALAWAWLAGQPASLGSILYVDDDAPAGGNGQSWNGAFRYLQDALAVAAADPNVAEIRVGAGVHRPDEDAAHPNGSGDRNVTFEFVNGVALYGGFAGSGAPDPDARDTALYETTLSGDLAGDDAPNFVNYGENSYHLVTADATDATAVLDGFTVSAGHAAGGSGQQNYGGAALIQAGSPTISNCVFRANDGHIGGGLSLLAGAVPVITNCVFSGNRSSTGGGAAYCEDSSPTFDSCVITGNVAAGATSDQRAGGITWCNGSPVITGCTITGNDGGTHSALDGGTDTRCREGHATLVGCMISGNSVATYGGGVVCSGATLRSCLVSGNASGDAGGGGVNAVGSTLVNCRFDDNFSWSDGGSGGGGLRAVNCAIDSCVFTENVDTFGGGGVACANSVVVNCIIERNTALVSYHQGGGGIMCDSSQVVNSLIIANTTTAQAGFGGGVLLQGVGSAVINCTIVQNAAGLGSAYGEGGGVYGPGIVRNSIIWSNSADDNDEIGATDASYCDVQGGYPGVGNIDADPLFVRAPSNGGDGWGDDPSTPDVDEGANDDFGDLPLLANSPCIDAGDNSAVPADALDLDEDGNTTEPLPFALGRVPRFIDIASVPDTGSGTPPLVDMGAYESVPVGDLNCDGAVDNSDITPFVRALIATPPEYPEYYTAYPDCNRNLGDINSDGLVDNFDITPFVRILTGA